MIYSWVTLPMYAIEYMSNQYRACWRWTMTYLTSLTVGEWPGGGVLPIWWVIHMCRGFDPLFWPSGYQTRSFLGCFFSSTNTKTIFWVQILAKFDLIGPKIPFFPWSFWVQFSVARATPPAIFGPSTPPPLGWMAGHSVGDKCRQTTRTGHDFYNTLFSIYIIQYTNLHIAWYTSESYQWP